MTKMDCTKPRNRNEWGQGSEFVDGYEYEFMVK